VKKLVIENKMKLEDFKSATCAVYATEVDDAAFSEKHQDSSINFWSRFATT
jgi:hypothetical protein